MNNNFFFRNSFYANMVKSRVIKSIDFVGILKTIWFVKKEAEYKLNKLLCYFDE